MIKALMLTAPKVSALVGLFSVRQRLVNHFIIASSKSNYMLNRYKLVADNAAEGLDHPNDEAVNTDPCDSERGEE